MDSNGLGPFSGVEVIWPARGYNEITHRLGLGERILTIQFCQENTGRVGSPDFRQMWVPYAIMGRAIAEGEVPDRVRADAVEYANAQDETARLREEDLLADVPPLLADVPPLVDEEPRDEGPEAEARSRALNAAQEAREAVAPIATRQRGPAVKKVVRQNESLGETVTTGLR